MNNVISGLEDHHPDLINKFLEELSLSRERANMPGLCLNGRQLDKLIREKSLQRLSELLIEENSPYLIAVEYLRSLKKVHSLMVSKTLDEEAYPTVLKEFRALFDQVHHLALVNETPKIHLISAHLEDWFRTHRETLWWADTSGNNYISKCGLSLIFS